MTVLPVYSLCLLVLIQLDCTVRTYLLMLSVMITCTIIGYIAAWRYATFKELYTCMEIWGLSFYLLYGQGHPLDHVFLHAASHRASPSHPSYIYSTCTADEACVGPKHVLHSGWLCMTCRPAFFQGSLMCTHTSYLASYPGCMGGEKCLSPPTRPGYEATSYCING